MPFSDQVRSRLDADAARIIGQYPGSRSALLPLLHLVQSEEGYVSEDGIQYCAAKLGLTEADVTGVVTFYTMYKRGPVGEYHVGVCTNTVCGVLGGNQILAELHEHLGVADDEVTPDGRVSVEHLECNAACVYAPVVMVNWEFFDNQTPASARQLADDLRAGNPVTPTRGPDRLVTWREAARILAGFNDGLALRVRPRDRPTWSASRSPRSTAGPRPSRTPQPTRRRTSKRRSRGDRHPDPGADRALGPARPLHHRRVPAGGRLPGAAEGARHVPGRGHRDREELRTARPRRGHVPDRSEVGLPAAGRRQAALPGGERGRIRTRCLQGRPADDGHPAHAHRGRGHRRLRDRGRPRVHLRPGRGPARHPAAAQRGAGGARGRVPRPEHPRLRVRPGGHHPRRGRRLHLRRGDRAAGLARG